MADIRDELKYLIQTDMLPEVESYMEDLHKPLENGKATQEDLSIIKEMESFMVELQNILEAIQRDMISVEQAQEVYDNMIKLIDSDDEVE